MDRPIRILHLEDDPRDAELIAATLAGGNVLCECHRVESRQEFEAALQRGGCDLILSDFSLPAFDGAAALNLARRLQPELPFILVSGAIGEEAAIESLVGSATDYVLKSRLTRLVPAVRRALAEAEDRRERHRAEEARWASEVKYRRLFESSKDGLLVMDGMTGRILDANASLLGFLGYAHGDVVGHTAGELGITGHDPACEAAFHEFLSSDEGGRPDLRVWGREGQVVDVDVVSNAYAVEGQRVVQCSFRDIRERRKLEDRLRLAQKLEAVGQLAGGVAHDFNNILAVINSYTDMAVHGLRPEDPLRADLEQVAEAGARAVALTRQLLAFSRRQVPTAVVLSWNAVVAGIETMLRRLIGEDLELRVRAADGLGNVRADPAQLEQVLMNLVLNARDAMPKGGRLDIETSDVELDAAYASQHPDVKPGSYVRLAVSDTGCGMDQTTLARAFEPFFTTKVPGKGTGLGLATVYGIVKQSGGHIGIDSEVGRGTTFRIYLPREEEAAVPVATRPRPARAGGSETVLVVEDDDGVRRLIRRVLEPAGYTVLCAGTGPEALQLCEGRTGPVHLLLTDVILPVMDGSTVAARFTALRPGIRVLFMSGYMDEVVGHHGVPVTGQDFLHKPFTAGELQARVRETLDRGIRRGP